MALTSVAEADVIAPILRLPKEILLRVLDILHPKQYNRGRAPVRRYRNDIEQWRIIPTLRLVCRSFNELTSPFLCPAIRVYIDQAAVTRMQNLLRNPLIRVGVQGLEVNLRFYPQHFASSLVTYRNHAIKPLSDGEGACDYHTEFWTYEADDRSDEALTHDAWHKAWQRLLAIHRTWDRYVHRSRFPDREPTRADNDWNTEYSPSEGPDMDSALIPIYEKVLQDGFENYVVRQQNQSRMIESGSFVESLVAALSQCPGTPMVWFADDDQRDHDYSRTTLEEVRRLGNDPVLLASRMHKDYRWLTVESLGSVDGEKISPLPARIMTELPIACHAAGVSILGMNFDVFPYHTSFTALVPISHHTNEEGAPTADAFNILARACGNLRHVEFGAAGMNTTPHRKDSIKDQDCQIIDHFLGAIFSGAYLEHFEVNMRCYERKNGNHPHHYRIGPTIRRLVSTNLRTVTLWNVEVDATDLLWLVKHLCKCRALRFISLVSIVLKTGGYMEVMDVIHGMIVERARNKVDTLRMHLSTLQGGEFGKFKNFENKNVFFLEDDERQQFWNDIEEYQHPELLKVVDKWVRDAETTAPNPLSVFHEQR